MKIKLTVSYIKIFLPNNKISGQITEKSGDYSSFFNVSQFTTMEIIGLFSTTIPRRYATNPDVTSRRFRDYLEAPVVQGQSPLLSSPYCFFHLTVSFFFSGFLLAFNNAMTKA